MGKRVEGLYTLYNLCGYVNPNHYNELLKCSHYQQK